MLINFSNHPIEKWEKKQVEAATQYGDIVDFPFPNIDAHLDELAIEQLATLHLNQIKEIGRTEETTIHIMGEMTFAFCMIKKLQNEGYTCIASTSQRQMVDLENGQKIVQFNFVKFRKYTPFNEK